MRSLKGNGIPMGKGPTVGEVIAKADKADQAWREQVERQKEAISGFLSYLADTDQMAEFNAWKQDRLVKRGRKV